MHAFRRICDALNQIVALDENPKTVFWFESR